VNASRTIVGRDPATGAGLTIEVADGRIASIGPATAAADAPYIAPGLVDLQVNGYGGLDLNGPDISVDLVVELTRKLVRLGTTTYLPTLITAAEDSIVRALRIVAEARRRVPEVARAVPAVHVEGPHVSPIDGPRGAHPLAHVRPPDIDEFNRWQAAAEGLVGLVTLSPEYPEAPAYIAALAAQGVVVSIGHTAATADDVLRAVDAGARLSTHLGNGAAAMLPRHPNFIWAQLADDRLSATFIADGHHLPADTFTAMLRAKTLARSVLVSDSVALAGMPPGRYRQPIGGDVVVEVNGRIGVADTPYLGGAGRPLLADLGIAMQMAGLSLAEALPLVTGNPARLIRREAALKPGAPADLLLLRHSAGSRDIALAAVFVAGEEQEITP
jgi:N-acetylglucosamine-6-phosphate deacetylase